MAAADAEHRRRAEQVGVRPAAPSARLARELAAAASRAAPRLRRRARPGPGARRAGSAAPAGARARRRGSRRSRGAAAWAMLGALGRQGLDDHLARRPRRGRCARRAGRPSRRSAPRRGSRGSAGSRRRRGSRSASPRGSRGPWRPSGCRPGRALSASPKRGEDRGRGRRAPAAVSESSRKTGIGASRSASSASICSVPAPARESVVEPHSGQARGSGSAWAQWWQTRRPLWRWTISETSQLGQSQWCPQERQVSQGAKPRRLIITIALAPAARTSSSASQVVGVQRARARVGLAHVDAPRPAACGGRRRGAAAPAAAAPASSPAAASRCRRRSTAPHSAARRRATARAS